MASSSKPREERKVLLLPARMIADRGWSDVTVCNASSRGMMLRCETPPVRNTFIEIRYRDACIVGRVVWSSGASFGINTQDSIDLADLLSQRSARASAGSNERRAKPRIAQYSVQVRTLSTEDSSRIFARLFDWSAVAFAVAAGALIVADLASETLQRPLGEVQQALHAGSSL